MPRPLLANRAVIDPRDLEAGRGSSLALVWAGLVLGVSFVATPAKFQAPSLPLPIALDVGRHTFKTFGRVEMALAALLGLRAATSPPRRRLALVSGLIVLAQALWLWPRLDARTQKIIDGDAASTSSNLHLVYVACEGAKLATLLALGMASARPGSLRHRRERRAFSSSPASGRRR